jgi:hypothetical protein
MILTSKDNTFTNLMLVVCMAYIISWHTNNKNHPTDCQLVSSATKTMLYIVFIDQAMLWISFVSKSNTVVRDKLLNIALEIFLSLFV